MMIERKVTVINPILHSVDLGASQGIKKKRVCAYARVSTDQEDQINSYKAQIHEYTRLINENQLWIFQGMYADEGLSGTSTKKRLQFLKMIDDAKEGEIDLILTKSISRFARNTVDSLTMIRELRGVGVEIFFEKENLYSSDPKVDFMLTIFSSIAQEESRNISENVKWGFRKRFKEGIVHINTKRFLGYDKDENKKIIINVEEAKIIKIIFNLYLSGSSTRDIANMLTDNNIKNGRGEVFWKPATVMSILTNEKYSGDVILQKRVTIDYLTHKSVVNTGQAPKYYITNNHEPIISKELFMIVQNIKKERSMQQGSSRFANRYPLSGIVYCGICHRKMNRQHYNPNTSYNRIVLSCKNGREQHCSCSNTPIDNQLLETLSAYVFHEINSEAPEIMNQTLLLLESNLTQPIIKEQIESAEHQVIAIENEIKNLIQLRISSTSTDDDKYYQSVFLDKKAELKRLNQTLSDYKSKLMDSHLNKERIIQLKSFLEEKQNIISREALMMLVKKIIVTSPTEVIFLTSSSDDEFINFGDEIEKYKKYLPILNGTYTHDGNEINWRLIEMDKGKDGH